VPSAIETKIFDPADGFAPRVDVQELTDATLAKRGDRWWMVLAGQARGDAGIELFTASLPAGAPLAATGWAVTPRRDDPTRVDALASRERSRVWDSRGGRHCPSYVRGWDPHRGAWVERIYYAGGARDVWGPSTIGYLEWDGAR
jgi:hypothetical protein